MPECARIFGLVIVWLMLTTHPAAAQKHPVQNRSAHNRSAPTRGSDDTSKVLASKACPAKPTLPPHPVRAEANRRFFLSGAKRVKERFRLRDGDTIWRRYEAVRIRRVGDDTVQLREIFRRGREWSLYRFRRVGGEFVPEGPQMEYDQQGRPKLVLHCPTGETRCLDWERFTWWPNDTLARAGSFHDGRAHGLHSAWYPNGRLRACLRYDDGRLLGVVGLWGPSAEALPIGTFQAGEGWLRQYSLNGTPIRERRFHKGLRRGARRVMAAPPAEE